MPNIGAKFFNEADGAMTVGDRLDDDAQDGIPQKDFMR
jgi:hypothetical protein